MVLDDKHWLLSEKKEEMVSVTLYLFEKLCLHVKLVIYAMIILNKFCEYTNCPPNT